MSLLKHKSIMYLRILEFIFKLKSQGYATAPPPDSRYGAPPVASSGYADPYGYKAPAAGTIFITILLFTDFSYYLMQWFKIH